MIFEMQIFKSVLPGWVMNIGVETIKQWLGAKIVFCRQNILKRTICCLSPLATVIMTKQRLLWSSKTAERKSQDQDGQLCVKHLPGWFASQPVSTRRSQCLWSRQVPTDQSNWIKQVNIFNSNPSTVQSQVLWICTCSYMLICQQYFDRPIQLNQTGESKQVWEVTLCESNRFHICLYTGCLF